MTTTNHVGTQKIAVLEPNTKLDIPAAANECVVSIYGNGIIYELDATAPKQGISNDLQAGGQLQMLGGGKRRIMEGVRLSPELGKRVRVAVEYYA